MLIALVLVDTDVVAVAAAAAPTSDRSCAVCCCCYWAGCFLLVSRPSCLLAIVARGTRPVLAPRASMETFSIQRRGTDSSGCRSAGVWAADRVNNRHYRPPMTLRQRTKDVVTAASIARLSGRRRGVVASICLPLWPRFTAVGSVVIAGRRLVLGWLLGP